MTRSASSTDRDPEDPRRGLLDDVVGDNHGAVATNATSTEAATSTSADASKQVPVIHSFAGACKVVFIGSGFYVLSMLTTPFEHIFVNYQFSRMGVEGAAPYALIVNSRGTINTPIWVIGSKLSSTVSKTRGKAEARKCLPEEVGEHFRVSLTLSVLESLASGAVFYFATRPAFTALGQSPETVDMATRYLERYAFATLAKAVALPFNAVAKGLGNPRLAWAAKAGSLAITNAIALHYYDPEQGNVDVFANAAIGAAALNTATVATMLACKRSYRQYKLFSCGRPTRASWALFGQRLWTLFKESGVSSIQVMMEICTLLAQAIYIKPHASKSALAFFDAESQLILLVVNCAMGLHKTAMIEAGRRKARNVGGKEVLLTSFAGLLLGTLPPLLTTASLATIPRPISEGFFPPTNEANATTVDPGMFRSPGAIATGNLVLDTLRIGSGFLLFNFNVHNTTAAVGISNTWAAFGFAIALNLLCGTEPLIAFAIANYFLVVGAAFLMKKLYDKATAEPERDDEAHDRTSQAERGRGRLRRTSSTSSVASDMAVVGLFPAQDEALVPPGRTAHSTGYTPPSPGSSAE